MKQFATYFTHGVRNGSKLRTESLQSAIEASRCLAIVDSFFEEQLSRRAAGGLNLRCQTEPMAVSIARTVTRDRYDPVKQVQLITDGACIGNPGPAAGHTSCVLVRRQA